MDLDLDFSWRCFIGCKEALGTMMYCITFAKISIKSWVFADIEGAYAALYGNSHSCEKRSSFVRMT